MPMSNLEKNLMEDFMERIDLGTVIQDAISKFSQNRIGEKPAVFVTLSPALPQVPCKDSTVKKFLRFFLYEALLTSDPDAVVEISLRRRATLGDLRAFVGVEPSYWIQVRISGRGLRIGERLVEDLFSRLSLREWVGGRIGRVGHIWRHRHTSAKMVFCAIETTEATLRRVDTGR
jgi:hypothetical protein